VRVVITGGAGFIGRHLAVAARAAGCRVSVVDVVAPPAAPFPWGLADVDGCEVVRADVSDREGLDPIFAGATAVAHLAGMASLRACEEQPLAAFRANALGTANVLDACAAASVDTVVTVSSRYVGSGEPADVYTATKTIAETWTRVRGGAVLRLDNVYGPGQGEGAVVADFISRARAGLPLSVAAATVPLLYVTDAVAALLALLRRPTPGRFHATAPAEAPLREVAAVVQALVREEPLPAATVPAPRGPDPALAGLGWRPRVDWLEGVRLTCAAWQGRPRARQRA
jgi:nucleoside-diphosphate-sugar epimerase